MQKPLYLFLFTMVIFVLPLAPTPSNAQNYDPYPWCAQYGGMGGGGGRNCGFVTWEQCQAAISGVGGYCEPNPFFTGPGPYAGPQPSERRAPRTYRHYRYERD